MKSIKLEPKVSIDEKSATQSLFGEASHECDLNCTFIGGNLKER